MLGEGAGPSRLLQRAGREGLARRCPPPPRAGCFLTCKWGRKGALCWGPVVVVFFCKPSGIFSQAGGEGVRKKHSQQGCAEVWKICLGTTSLAGCRLAGEAEEEGGHLLFSRREYGAR